MAAISDGTICCVCAEPLEWTAFGVCNHKDTCSKCVARWRFVLKDNTCMVCKTELSSVYITRCKCFANTNMSDPPRLIIA
ncbi:hypothetical protein DUNSADRAFT_7933 [Dunaliella salina]|uniref:RING-type domain-containing protein n=1 Tax=Dunaliella salina TaxID=3046 RepID=A0ABQ7FT48_DUNSA|nr:hypothetical protein DUNSADRAFT_7933 [Dunaliella salina]|eukprot:KAF5825633.1 hypothetical protein DUNSADRAFT_7933 [Dunaliella salina]